MSRTRIVATIGPSTCSPALLRELSDAGMNMVRLNGSHADLDWHANTIKLVRDTLEDMPILLDIPGRKIRTCQLDHEPAFEAGDTVILTSDADFSGPGKVPLNRDDLHLHLNKGDIVRADDGTLSFTVVLVEDRDIHCRAQTKGILRSRKGINVPHVALAGPLVTDRDRQMIQFAKTHDVDFVGISFVESSQHVQAIRDIAQDGWPRIIAKIENEPGMQNMDEIVQNADAVMIDRGDLSVETNIENVAIYQKDIIKAATLARCPVIVATEMLHTMIDNNYPTKAEVSDITNAVFDGASAVMLSGETAIGDHPVEAVTVMRGILSAAEQRVHDLFDDNWGKTKVNEKDAMGDAAALICRSLPITHIIAVTHSGYAARALALKNLRQPLIAVSDDHRAARAFNLLPGTVGFYADSKFLKHSTDHIIDNVKALWESGMLSQDDIVLVTGLGYPGSGKRMNLLQTHRVGDLKESLNWQK